MIVFLFFHENKTWRLMQIGDNLYEMSGPII